MSGRHRGSSPWGGPLGCLLSVLAVATVLAGLYLWVVSH